MPKRSIEDKIQKLNSKIRKLEQKKHNVQHRKRLRTLSSSSKSGEENHQETTHDPEIQITQDDPMLEQSNIEQPGSPEITMTPHINPNLEPTPGPEMEPSTSNEVIPSVRESGLDPELLLALGESTSEVPDYGKAIHESLAKLWLPVLKKGLSKEIKENLMKQHLIPDNCKLLQSPKLNEEITAAVSELVRGRDKKLIGFQQQLGAGITAANRGMDVLLSSDSKAEAMKQLSDACRILTDLHHSFTKDRIKLIIPSLEKNILHVIQDTERDDMLFGNSLSEKIKASKAITRQGLQIKKNVPNYKAGPAVSQSPATRPAPLGNWRGPPRHQYQSSRGGRGGYKKTFPAQRTYTNSTAPAKPANQYRSRAPTQQ